MSTRPILFNTEMVSAILDGRKTVTRRIVKEKGWRITGIPKWVQKSIDGRLFWFTVCSGEKETAKSATVHALRPPYIPNDILYVRETWCTAYDGEKYFFLADKNTQREEKRLLDYDDVRWHPSIHMPKKAARLFLRVKRVWVERLQDITIPQIVAEGAWEDCIECLTCYSSTGIQCCIGEEDECSVADSAFEEWRNLWDSTIKAAGLPIYGYDANPWVWVIEFERISKEEALKGGGTNV